MPCGVGEKGAEMVGFHSRFTKKSIFRRMGSVFSMTAAEGYDGVASVIKGKMGRRLGHVVE